MAPIPSAAERSPIADQEKPGRSPGFLLAGPALWWRGLKAVSCRPWLLWFCLASVLAWWVQAVVFVAFFHQGNFGWLLPPYVLPDENTSIIEYLQLSVIYAVFNAFRSFDMALTELPGPLGLIVFIAVLYLGWANELRGRLTPTTKKGRTATLLFVTVVLVASAFGTAFLSMDTVLRLMGRGGMPQSYAPIARICYMELTPAQAVGEAFMFGALGALVLLSSRNAVSFATAAGICLDRFWPLFAFYVFFHLQQLMSILLGALGVSPHFVFPLAVTRALSVLKLASTPLPFLIVAEGTALTDGITLLLRFYQEAFRRVWPLMAVTTGGLAVLYLARSATFLMAGPYRYSSQIVTEVIFLLGEVLISLGGVAGMFLLIEEWRAGMSGGLVRERQPASDVVTGEADVSSQAREE
jgi:hypothetical protein